MLYNFYYFFLFFFIAYGIYFKDNPLFLTASKYNGLKYSASAYLIFLLFLKTYSSAKPLFLTASKHISNCLNSSGTHFKFKPFF